MRSAAGAEEEGGAGPAGAPAMSWWRLGGGVTAVAVGFCPSVAALPASFTLVAWVPGSPLCGTNTTVASSVSV